MTTVTQAEFAKIKGWNRSSVTRAKKSGRLVMSGGLVEVEASEARLIDSSGGRDDVAQRHAQDRARSDESGAGEVLVSDEKRKALESRAGAQARKESALADLAELEFKQKQGRAVDKSEVEAVAADVMVLFRQQIENQAHRLAAQLVGKDIDATRALLKQDGNEIIGNVWKELDRRLKETGAA